LWVKVDEVVGMDEWMVVRWLDLVGMTKEDRVDKRLLF
jgi:hypothetical protein